MADGDLPVPGSAGPWHAVPAGCHLTAIHRELTQLEGVQLCPGKGAWALPLPCVCLPIHMLPGFSQSVQQNHSVQCPRSLAGLPRSSDKGAAWDQLIFTTSGEARFRHVKKPDGRTLNPGLHILSFCNSWASETKAHNMESLSMLLIWPGSL